MKYRVDWVSQDKGMFAVVAWSTDRQEALDAYLELDQIPNSEGVFSTVTEESAIRACGQGSGKDLKITEESKSARAYFMRMVMPATRPTKLNDVLTRAQLLKIAGV